MAGSQHPLTTAPFKITAFTYWRDRPIQTYVFKNSKVYWLSLAARTSIETSKTLMSSCFITQTFRKLLVPMKAGPTASWDFTLVSVIPCASVALAGVLLLHPRLYGYFNFILGLYTMLVF